MLLREGTDDLEVLLLRRNRSAGFVPGAYVFPGGRVDPGDGASGALERVDGLTPEEAAARLDLVDGDPPAIAYYVAALREAFEETGILVAACEDGSLPRTAAEDAAVDRIRDQLMADRIDFAEVLRRMECRVDGRAMEYLAHWITPESSPRRFDTRFFAVEAPPGAEAVVDPREMTDARWITPGQAMEEHEDGDLPMIMPTIRTLEQLGAYRRPLEALATLAELEVPRILPKLETTPLEASPPLRGDG